MAVFNFVSAPLNEHQNSTLSLFQQFLMTMIKLRLNLSDQDIAYRFGVSQPTVSKTFRKWINQMYIRLKPIIKWPSHEEVKTMPSVFVRGFKRCICIIDCFEVFCERHLMTLVFLMMLIMLSVMVLYQGLKMAAECTTCRSALEEHHT